MHIYLIYENYNLLALRGRGGVNDMGVLSATHTIFRPAICNPFTALILPGPSPWISTRTLEMPFSRAIYEIKVNNAYLKLINMHNKI